MSVILSDLVFSCPVTQTSVKTVVKILKYQVSYSEIKSNTWTSVQKRSELLH